VSSRSVLARLVAVLGPAVFNFDAVAVDEPGLAQAAPEFLRGACEGLWPPLRCSLVSIRRSAVVFLRSDTSLRTKRISSFRKFRLLPPKDFFDSIDPNRTFGRLDLCRKMLTIG
jgi:hypothetical protein